MTVAPQKVLSVRLYSKSDQKSSNKVTTMRMSVMMMIMAMMIMMTITNREENFT